MKHYTAESFGNRVVDSGLFVCLNNKLGVERLYGDNPSVRLDSDCC
jgi:hypothetical protein